jgi:hypothetical protein
MKNIHVLPTHKPSRLHFDGKLFLSPNYQVRKRIDYNVEGRNIYITSDVEIKNGDWVLNIEENTIFKPLNDEIYDIKNSESKYYEYCKKIILTTDPDLIKDGVQAIDQVWIKDGVQAIDDDFLEWFVKNPSCEFVELGLEHYFDKNIDKPPFFPLRYKIRIPQEDPKFISGQPFLEKADEVIVIHRPKQETLEEVAERLLRDHRDFEVEGDSSYQNGRLNGILEGLKYQAERMYSEEEVRDAFALGMDYYAEPNDWDKVTPKQKLENLLIKKQ